MSMWNGLTILLALLCAVNLVLTFGLIKRMREHDVAITQGKAVPEPILQVGERVDDFSAVTVDGETLDRAKLVEGTLVGFFDPLCETCHSHLPSFSELARSLPGGRAQVLAVVRKEEEAEEMVAILQPVAQVILERRRGPVATAFHLQATPAFCRLGADQIVLSHGYDDKEPVPA